jgi:phage tail-like protein
MNPPEIRRQVFRSADHWRRGLSYRLGSVSEGGLALLSRPVFAGWVTQAAAARNAGSMATDACGRVYWVQPREGRLYRLDPASRLIDPVATLPDGAGTSPARFGRLLYAGHRLWLLDLGGARLLAFRPDTFQIIVEIGLSRPTDIATARGRLIALDAEAVRRFDLTGRELGSTPRTHILSPTAMGVDPTTGTIYLLDGNATGFLRLEPDGAFRDEVGTFAEAGAGFAPRLLAVSPSGNLFVSNGTAAVHEFAADGSYVGHVEGMGAFTKVLALGFDAGGELGVAMPPPLPRFGNDGALVGKPGTFYSPTLDNGAQADEAWHRLDLSAELGAGGAIDVWYASSKDEALVAAVNGALQRAGSAARRAADLEALLGGLWNARPAHRLTAPEAVSPQRLGELRSRVSHSVLFEPETKRYLWLKLALSGLTPRAAVTVREMRVYYPRLSYLRYLPATYQENKPSRAFLERFLSLFETVFGDLEATVARIPEVFTPGVAPTAFLDWLAQWLDLGIEEDWTEAVKRRLIERAATLYERKGTPEGLAEFIEVVLGQRPLILESFEAERPLVVGGAGSLGHDLRLGTNASEAVPRSQLTVLDGTTRLGASPLRASARRPVDPYRAAAYRFTLVLRLSPGQLRRHQRALDRIIREHAPAHLAYDLVLESGARFGRPPVVGVNATLEPAPPVRVGFSALGHAACTRAVRYGPELDMDTTLSDAADARCRTAACS